MSVSTRVVEGDDPSVEEETLLPMAERERGVLARCLVSTDFLDHTAKHLLLSDFMEPGHGAIFQCLLAAYDLTGQPPTTSGILAQADRLNLAAAVEVAGGRDTIEALQRCPVSLAEAQQYIGDLRNYTDSLELQRVGRRIQDLGAGRNYNAVSQAEELVLAVSARRNPAELTLAGDMVGEILSSVKGERPIDARLSFSGLTALDGPVVAFQPGKLVMFAALSHVGKTVVALNVTSRFARYSGAAVLFFALEQGARELTRLLLAMWTGPHVPWMLKAREPSPRICISPRRIQLLELTADRRSQAVAAARRFGQDELDLALTDLEKAELANAAAYVRQMELSFDTASGGISYMRSALRRHARNHKDVPLWAVLDYIQIAPDERGGSRSETEVLQDLSREIKLSARSDMDGRGSWWVNAQFNRLAEKALADADPSDKPLAIYNHGMLKGSGSLEQNSDVVIFGHRADRHPDLASTALYKPWSELSFGFAKNRQTGIMTNTASMLNMTNLALVDASYDIYTVSVEEE